MIASLYDTFKLWSTKGSVYIISDTHFDDKDCKLMDPTWPSAQEQLDILKKYITKNDTLIHLGDVGNTEWIAKLNCYKVLIMGNHDVGKSKYLREKTYVMTFTKDEDSHNYGVNSRVYIPGTSNYHGYRDNKLFDEVYEGPLMISEKILLSHEPILGLSYVLNIHGHDHSGSFIDTNHINVASNVCNYTPLNLGAYIKEHGLSKIKSIHRQTIDNATERKQRLKKYIKELSKLI